MEGSDECPGIIPRTFEYIAQQVAMLSTSCKYFAYLSFMEIYNEEAIDLLAPPSKAQGQGFGGGPAKNGAPKLEVKESKGGGVLVSGLSSHVVEGTKDMMRKLQQGKRNRKVRSLSL